MNFNINKIAPNHWAQKTIEEVCMKVTSGGTPSRRNLDFYKNGNIPWVKTKELKNARLYKTEELITPEALNKSSAKILPKDTILLAMYGATVGELGILAKEMTCNQACCALIVDNTKADYKYLFYMLSFHKDSIKNLASGAAQQNLSATQIKSFQFPYPDTKTQKKISKTLSDIDDKIEKNQRMNKTLEEMAQAIFKSWFVDFKPVHAKVEVLKNGGSEDDARLKAMCIISGKSIEDLASLKSKNPENYAELECTADAFPTDFTDSELGKIPKGWKVEAFGDLITPKKGKTITKGTIEHGNVPVVAGGLEPAYYHRTANVTSPAITISSSGANAGYANLYYEDIWASDCSYINKTQTDFIFSVYSLLKLRQGEIFSMQQGAAQPHIYSSDIMRIIITDPPKMIWEKCERLQVALYTKVGKNLAENKILTKTRNALLPKLLSGEIDVNKVGA